MESKDLHTQKLNDYNQFLKITNKKPQIFRDIVIENECKSFNSIVSSHFTLL